MIAGPSRAGLRPLAGATKPRRGDVGRPATEGREGDAFARGA